MNYRELLLKYLAHIIEVEGSTFMSEFSMFTPLGYVRPGVPQFTEAEVEELCRLETETRLQYKDI